jgi:hypothetical protein
LLKFKGFLNKKKNSGSKSFECLGKCHKCGKLSHWANSCPKLKKPKVDKGSNSRTKLARCHIKRKEVHQPEFEKVANIVGGEESKEDDFEDHVDFFEAIVANLELENSKNPTNCWYLDLACVRRQV